MSIMGMSFSKIVSKNFMVKYNEKEWHKYNDDEGYDLIKYPYMLTYALDGFIVSKLNIPEKDYVKLSHDMDHFYENLIKPGKITIIYDETTEKGPKLVDSYLSADEMLDKALKFKGLKNFSTDIHYSDENTVVYSVKTRASNKSETWLVHKLDTDEWYIDNHPGIRGVPTGKLAAMYLETNSEHFKKIEGSELRRILNLNGINTENFSSNITEDEFLDVVLNYFPVIENTVAEYYKLDSEEVTDEFINGIVKFLKFIGVFGSDKDIEADVRMLLELDSRSLYKNLSGIKTDLFKRIIKKVDELSGPGVAKRFKEIIIKSLK